MLSPPLGIDPPLEIGFPTCMFNMGLPPWICICPLVKSIMFMQLM